MNSICQNIHHFVFRFWGVARSVVLGSVLTLLWFWVYPHSGDGTCLCKYNPQYIMRTKYSCAISFKICFCNIFQNIRVQYLSKLVCTTSLCSGCVHPVQFCSDNHHHWLPEEYPDHVSGHDDWRYYILPTYIAYISWWLEGTTSTAFSTSSGSTSASLEVLSTQKVSLEEICFCCFHQHFLLQ